jgi:hypothetical protein
MIQDGQPINRSIKNIKRIANLIKLIELYNARKINKAEVMKSKWDYIPNVTETLNNKNNIKKYIDKVVKILYWLI